MRGWTSAVKEDVRQSVTSLTDLSGSNSFLHDAAVQLAQEAAVSVWLGSTTF